MNLIVRWFSVILVYVKLVIPTSSTRQYNIYLTDAAGTDIADYIASKGYIPNEKKLPQASSIKDNENYSAYILSKLTDEELLKLFTETPSKNEYSLKDIMKTDIVKEFNIKERQENSLPTGPQVDNLIENRIIQKTVGQPLNQEKEILRTDSEQAQNIYFKLNNMAVDTKQNDANYKALLYLKNLLIDNQRIKTEDITGIDTDNKKELMFDTLVAQLKAICCKSNKKPDSKKGQYKTLINEILPSLLNKKTDRHPSTPIHTRNYKNNEFMFLIINDEIRSTGSDELISLDPQSLDSNSSILLLGPVTTSLSAAQLKLVMSRISIELTKPDYLSLLQQLSDGALSDSHKKGMNTFMLGPETRRYIKPHRCNHQSKLAKVYGGPKWIICTGYLNLNKPSLYD